MTEEKTPKTYTLTDQASQANIEAYVSEGQQQVLRVRNVIKAQNNTEDIVLGYDITLTAVVMLPEVLALIDGGTWDGRRRHTRPRWLDRPLSAPVHPKDLHGGEGHQRRH